MSCSCGAKGTKAHPLQYKYGKKQCKQCIDLEETLAQKSANVFTQNAHNKRNAK